MLQKKSNLDEIKRSDIMNSNKIKNIFSNYLPQIEGTYLKSSVMVLLFEKEDGFHVLFNKRSFKLKHQPGDICFPGGRQEENETPIETAYREVYEELGINRSNIEIIGKSDTIVTTGRGVITPFIGIVKNINIEDVKYSTDEVENIFTVPLSFFFETQPDVYSMSFEPILPDNFPYHLIVNGENYKFVKTSVTHFFYKYKDYVIWGITAKIISNIIDIIKKEKTVI